MSYPEPSSDLIKVRVDSYTAEPGAALTEAVEYAKSLVAIPDGQKVCVYSAQLEGELGPTSRTWEINVSLGLFTPYVPPPPKPEKQKRGLFR